MGIQETFKNNPFHSADGWCWCLDDDETGVVVVEYWGNRGMEDRTKEHHVVIPSELEGLPVTELGCAFWERHVTSVAIPDTVRIIRRDAFACVGLRWVEIPASVRCIQEQADHFKNVAFHCPRGSYAEQYAKEHNIKVKYTD